MTNPIADPLVENALSPDLEGLAEIQAGASGVAVVTINGVGPDNALNSEVAAALKEAFETLHAADHVRLVLLRGRGGVFSGGVDLDWLRTAAEDFTADDLKDEALVFADMLEALTHIPALTVALVEGTAAGMGAGLVAACDMAVALSGARIGFPGVKMGAVPAVAAPYVVNAVGPRQAKGLFMTGRMLEAEDARSMGLVQMVVERGEFGAALSALAQQTLENAPEAMHEAKRLVWDVWGRPLDHRLRDETARRWAHTRLGEEGREGLNAALEGRPPTWANP